MTRLLVLALILVGCGTARTDHAVTRAEATETVDTYVSDASGVLAVASRVITSSRHSSTTDATAVLTVDAPAILAPLAAAASAATGATPWGAIGGLVGILTTAATGVYAAHKSATADAERKRAEEHRADADEGWKKADSYALQLPPPVRD